MGFKWYQIIIFAGLVIGLALLMLPPQRERGILLARSGRGLEADEILDEIIRNNPEDAMASIELAKGLMIEGDSQRADEVLSYFMIHNSNYRKYLKEIATIYESGFFYERAIDTLAVDPAKYRKELIELCIRAGMLERGIAFIQQGLTGKPSDVKALHQMERLQQWSLDINSAGKTLEEIAALEPNRENIYAALNFYFWRTAPDKLEFYSSRLEKFKKLDIDQARLLRVSWIYLRKLPQAINAAERVCAFKKSNETDWIDYGALLSWSSDYAKALEVTAQATKKFPKSTTLLWQQLAFARKLDKLELVAELNLKMSKLISDTNLIREAADIYDKLGMSDKAIALYRQLEESKNKKTLDTLRLAQLYLKNKDDKKAALYSQQLFNKLQKGNAAGEDEELLANAAELMGRMGKTGEQKTLLEELTRKGSYEAYLLLSDIYNNAGDRLKALEALTKIDSDAPGDIRRRAAVSAAFLLSEEAFDESKSAAIRKLSRSTAERAIHHAFAMAEKHSPKNPVELSNLETDIESLRGSLFYIYMADDKITAAQNTLEKMRSPDNGQILTLAFALADEGNYAATEKWLARIPSTDTLEGGQLGQLGEIYLLLEKNQLALQTLLKADEKSGSADKAIRLALARAYGATGNWKEQYKIVDYYASLPEATEEDWTTAADARSQQEDLIAEEQILATGSKRFPKSAMLLARRVNLLAAMGYRQKAKQLAWGLSGLRLKKDINSLIIVFYAMLGVGQDREAGRILQLALNTDPQEPSVLLAQARLYAAKRELRQALLLYKQYLQKEKTDAAGWFELAQIRREMGIWGDRQAAEKARGFLKLTSSDDWTLEAGIARFLGNNKRALFASTRAKDIQSNIPARHLDLAVLYNENALPKYAAAQAQKGLSLNPGYMQLRRQQASSNIQQRKFDKGISELQALLREEDNPQNIADIQSEIGYVKAEKGDWKSAAKNFSQAAEILQATPQPSMYGAMAEVIMEPAELPVESDRNTEDVKK